MTHQDFHLRLEQAAAVLAKLREPQEFKDHDRSSRYLANRLPSYNPK